MSFLGVKFGSYYKKGFKGAWGLAIGDEELKAVKVESHDGELLIEAVDRVEYSAISQEFTSEKSELIEEAVSVFAKRNLIEKSDKIIVSLPGKRVLSKFVSLPPMKKSHFLEAIKFELQKQIPFGPDEIVWDSHQFGDSITGDKGTEVGIFATKKENIYSLLPSLVPIRMNLEGIQVTPLAIYNLMRWALSSDEDVFVVNVEKENTDFIVVGKSKYWNRSIPVTEVNMDLVREIQRSMGYYVSLSKGIKHEKIFLMGEVFKDNKKIKFVEENLEGNITFLNLLDKAETSKNVDRSVFDIKAVYGFGTALGLALQGLDLGKINVNLLPFEYIRERQVPRQKVFAGIITISIFIALFSQSIKDYMVYRGRSKAVNTVNATYDRVKKMERNYKNIGKEVEEEEKKLQTLASIGTQGSFWIEAIRKIVDIMPEKVYLLSMKSLRDLPYAEEDEKDSSEKGSGRKKRNTSKKTGKPEKVLIMSIKGESYDPSMSYLEEMIKKPLENLKLFNRQDPTFRNVEFVQGSVHHVDSIKGKRRFANLNIDPNMRPIAFEIRWMVNTIN